MACVIVLSALGFVLFLRAFNALGCSYPEVSGKNATSLSNAVSPFSRIAWTPSQS